MASNPRVTASADVQADSEEPAVPTRDVEAEFDAFKARVRNLETTIFGASAPSD